MKLSRLSRIALLALTTSILFAACGTGGLGISDSGTSFAITYILDGGTNASGNPASYVSGDLPLTFAAPTKTGYTFSGWYSDAALSSTFTSIPTGRIGNLSVYAKWNVVINNTISYNLDAGTNASGNPSTYSSTDLPLTFAAPTKAGYSFGGWYSDAGLTTSYASIAANTTGAVAVYAKWLLVINTITYNNMSGATNAASNPSTYSVSTLPITLAAPTKTGYTFGGWYSDVALTTAYSTIAANTTGAVAVYAKWTPVASGYGITYNLDSGANSSSNPATYSSSVLPLVFAAPTKAGYAFGGWYSNSALTSSYAFIPTGTSAAVAVYAKWTALNTSNFASGCAVTTSGTEAGYDLPGYYAVDGSASTRWSSQTYPTSSNPAWIALDLGAARSVNTVAISWEASPSGTWAIQYSSDGTSWTNKLAAIAAPSGNFTSTTNTGLGLSCRYLRIYATGTQGTAGVSIYEITVN